MGKHKSSYQDEVSLYFMQGNESLARGFAKGDRVAAEAKWSELVGALNAIGPPIKDVAGWKKVWCDWKANIRKKIAQNKAEFRATGGGPYCQQPLTAMERTWQSSAGFLTWSRELVLWHMEHQPPL
ncbi:uncharacterized protein [Drosophila bipectinata]|uniref:uncharacterized protein n=1 Tax=Drosophila bipectinata TaxID=42026 RepID=UPI0007E7362E|nr:uncharacterized protein LOC108134066 [Drosophila bipectinata]